MIMHVFIDDPNPSTCRNLLSALPPNPSMTVIILTERHGKLQGNIL